MPDTNMHKHTRFTTVQALACTACLAVSLLFVGDACTVVTNTTAVQCLSEAECLAKGPDFANTTCGAESKTCVPIVQSVGLCQTNAECTVKNGGTSSICRKKDKKCVVLRTAECPTVHGTKEQIENEKVIFVGLIDPASAGELGLMFNKVVQYVQEEFTQESGGGLPSIDGTPGTRPVVFVGCNEFGAGIEGLQRGARHLVNEIGVPSIVGPIDSQNVFAIEASILLPAKVMSITPVSVVSALNDLPNPIAPTQLIWRPAVSDSALVKVVAPFVQNQLAQRTIDLAIRTGAEPLRVLVLAEGNIVGVTLQRRIQDILKFNGDKTAIQNSMDMPPNYAVANFGDFNDPTNNPNPSRKITQALQQVFAFKPHIVIHSSNILTVPRVFASLEALWPATSGPKPIHVSLQSSWISKPLFDVMATDPTLKQRVFVASTKADAGSSRIGTFFLNFKQKFPEFNNAANNPLIPNIYDSAYLMIYALAAVGNKPITGESIAVGMSRLGPPGTQLTDDAENVAQNLKVLTEGGNLDLIGLSGPLDFDVKEGGVVGDSEIRCPQLSGSTVIGFQSSKYSYSASKSAAGFDTGATALACP